MSIKRVLSGLDFTLNEKNFLELKKEIDEFVGILRSQIKKDKIRADVFLGGSFAKGTLAKSENYDADIFVRFDLRYENLSDVLEKVLKKIAAGEKLKLERLHGSRDYFRIWKSEELTLEIIPVLKISKVKKAKNVTDLSYFHVNYVRRHLKGKMKNEMAIAKKFCQIQKVYGAESYINGFSGYGLECLIIQYKTFEKLIRSLIKVEDEKLILDPAKHYKKKNEIFVELNESKLQSPVILIDPTWKERNVLASLNRETFRRFQESAKKFLNSPSEKFFQIEEVDEEKMKNLAKKNKAEFLHVVLETDRQEGDIAGTKMRKFGDFLTSEIGKYFEIEKKEFSYDRGKTAELKLVLKSKKEIERKGPPVEMKKESEKFKKRNKNTFVKNGRLCVKIKIDFSAREFLGKWSSSKEGKRKMSEMSVSGMKIVN